jgi:transcription-repair coupling factor (superfamily II helicase)
VPVLSLLEVARLRSLARRAGLTDITQQGNHIRFSPVELPESREVRVQRLYPRTLLKPTVRTMLVPVPKAVPGTRAGSSSPRAGAAPTVSLGVPPLRDTELLAWCEELVTAVFGADAPAGPDAPAAKTPGQAGSQA